MFIFKEFTKFMEGMINASATSTLWQSIYKHTVRPDVWQRVRHTIWDFKPKYRMFKEASHSLGVRVLQGYHRFYDSLVNLLKKRERFMTETVIKL